MNAVNVMDVKKQSDRDKVGRIIDGYADDGTILKGEAIDQIFALFTPKQYRPFEVSDFNEFMLKQVRRKGEAFKDEFWYIEGAANIIDTGVTVFSAYITIEIFFGNFSSEWKSFQTMFDEWEFSNGECFGKLI